jgi:hypothetical protein
VYNARLGGMQREAELRQSVFASGDFRRLGAIFGLI